MIQKELLKFYSIFIEPKGFPPYRLVDHHIHLSIDTKPIHIKTYCYPYFQKSKIKKLVKELLKVVIIRLRTSSFSSPVILVQKKDGTLIFL